MGKSKIRWAAVVAVAALGLAACGGSTGKTAQQREQAAQNNDSYNLVTNQPLPVYTHSQIRQELIDIENAEANGLQSTSFFENFGVNYSAPGVAPPASCPSIGAPVPVTDELSNPQKIVDDGYPSGGASDVLSQMDPNGIYTGSGSGTWVMCVDSQGDTYAHYWEGPVDVVFGPAVWKGNGPVLVGAPSAGFSDIKSK